MAKSASSYSCGATLLISEGELNNFSYFFHTWPCKYTLNIMHFSSIDLFIESLGVFRYNFALKMGQTNHEAMLVSAESTGWALRDSGRTNRACVTCHAKDAIQWAGERNNCREVMPGAKRYKSRRWGKACRQASRMRPRMNEFRPSTALWRIPPAYIMMQEKSLS